MTTNSTVDWSTLPAPVDDGAVAHLIGTELPSVSLPSTDGRMVDLSVAHGRTVVFVYPRTGKPGSTVPADWDAIPGARGCSPQACSFRDHFDEIKSEGVQHLYGLSSQATEEQLEAAQHFNLPFPLLSDSSLNFAKSLNLPTFSYDGKELVKRLSLIIKKGKIEAVFYPVFPPDKNAEEVVFWLRQRRV